MENFKARVTLEPTNEYDKAKQDLIKALNSLHALPPYLQQQVVQEVFGAQAVAAFIDMCLRRPNPMM